MFTHPDDMRVRIKQLLSDVRNFIIDIDPQLVFDLQRNHEFRCLFIKELEAALIEELKIRYTIAKT